jgi:hypothetical protein
MSKKRKGIGIKSLFFNILRGTGIPHNICDGGCYALAIHSGQVSITLSVPEPATILLFSTGVGGLASCRRKGMSSSLNVLKKNEKGLLIEFRRSFSFLKILGVSVPQASFSLSNTV